LNTTLGDSLDVLTHQQHASKSLDIPPYYLVQPVIPAGVTTLTGFHRVGELVVRGEEATFPVLPALEKTLQSTRNQPFSDRLRHYYPEQRAGSRDIRWLGF
jgi:hypothetical protein